jgi:uroporphyrinogen III methyltransferase/synthase
VDVFFKRLTLLKLNKRILRDVDIAVIGSSTARRLEKYKVSANVIADSYRSEGLLKKLSKRLVSGKAILIPRAEKARSVLADELQKSGAKVTIAICYRSVIPPRSRGKLRRLIREDPPDLVTFASSSMVNNFKTILKKERTLWDRARKIPCACIGPITAQTAKDCGLKVAIQPKKSTISDLVEAIKKKAK